VKTNLKWTAERAVTEAEAGLRPKDIVAAALLNSVLLLSWKEAEQRNVSWPSLVHMKP